MQCVLYKIYFWKVFHMYYKLICILYALLCGQKFILVKSGCYILLMVSGELMPGSKHAWALGGRVRARSCGLASSAT
jgi:hypothetical protein